MRVIVEGCSNVYSASVYYITLPEDSWAHLSLCSVLVTFFGVLVAR